MAKQDIIDTTTSYTDPVYDRLESTKNHLARLWPLVVIIAIVVAVVVVMLRQSLESTPVAASAAQYQSVMMSEPSIADWQAMIDDPEITTAFRVRAGLELAQMQQADLALDQAAQTLESLSPLATESADTGLVLSLNLSKAAISEQRGELDQALAQYTAVFRDSLNTHPAHRLTAELGQGRVYMLQADAMGPEGDAATTLELRQQAYETFESVANRRISGAEQVRQLASFLARDLARQYPAVKPADEAASTAPAISAANAATEEPVAGETAAQASDASNAGSAPQLEE